MKPAAMLQELLQAIKKNPGSFDFQDGFTLDELRKQRKQGHDMTKKQAEKVQQLHSHYIQGEYK